MFSRELKPLERSKKKQSNALGKGRQHKVSKVFFPGGGVLPYMGYIGMCVPKGYGFSAVLVINRVSIIAILPPLWS